MIKTISAIAFVASLSFAATAMADDIPATPMNHGPMVVRGMGPAGDLVNVGLTPINVLAPPTIAVGGAVGGAVAGTGPVASSEPAAEAAPRKHHRHHRKHAMMKKKKM